MDAFDADVLIDAAAPGHPLGAGVRSLLLESDRSTQEQECIGSVLLLPELLSKPSRDGADAEVTALLQVLARLDLIGVDEAIAALAVDLGARHRLRTADAIHLATAVSVGADRFITNNRRDFGAGIDEIDVTYPDQLED